MDDKGTNIQDSDQSKQLELNSLLGEMAKVSHDIQKETLVDWDRRLDDIYEGAFRHQYSEIFSIITALDSEDTCDINVIPINLRELKNYLEKKEECRYSNQIRKLIDHVSLEVARLSYTKTIAQKQFDRIKDAETQLSQLESRILKSKKRIGKIATIVQSAQKEYIAILGIFASILITFFTGISFSNNILSNLATVNAYKICFAICLLGFVVVSITYILFLFLLTILELDGRNKNIRVEIHEKYIYVIRILGLLLCMDIILWLIGGTQLRIIFYNFWEIIAGATLKLFNYFGWHF